MPVSKGLEIWTAQTLCDVGIMLSIVSFLLHIGRPYFERILGRMTLRVAADIWWVAYVALRDGSLLVSVLFGFLHLNLDIMADIKVGIPFVPLATVASSIALVKKVFRNTEDLNAHYLAATVWTTVGAVLNTTGYVFVMEGPGAEYSVSGTAFWQVMHGLRSNQNPELAVWTFYIAFGVLGCVAVYATFQGLSTLRKAAQAADEHVQA